VPWQNLGKTDHPSILHQFVLVFPKNNGKTHSIMINFG
jgi:hypothetical protein